MAAPDPTPRLRFADIRRTSVFRLASLFGIAGAVGVCLLAGLIYALTARQLVARTDRVLNLEIARLARLDPAQLPEGVRTALAGNASGLNYYGMRSSEGRLLAGNLVAPPNSPIGRPFEFGPDATTRVPLRALAYRLPDGSKLLVARDIAQLRAVRHQVFVIVSLSATVALLGLFGAGIALSLGPLRRTQVLEAAANRIAVGEIHVRMPISARRDEIDTFALTVNRMVDEIERLMDEIKGTTDAIAHDLRTPLSRLRNRLEAARDAAAARVDPVLGARADVIIDAIEDLDALLGRFNALMRISEIHVARRRSGFRLFDVFTVAAAVAELFEPLAEERTIRLSLTGSYGLLIEGDEKLLFEALSNLVENAIKFIPDGGEILVAVEGVEDGVRVDVRDNGPGIAESERAAVLRRFQRGSAARNLPGHGLGLNLVAAIARLHATRLELLDADPGLKASIVFRKSPPQEPVENLFN